nr:MAG TPA: hypothetical protein [Caudoviricetes sp.]
MATVWVSTTGRACFQQASPRVFIIAPYWGNVKCF